MRHDHKNMWCTSNAHCVADILAPAGTILPVNIRFQSMYARDFINCYQSAAPKFDWTAIELLHNFKACALILAIHRFIHDSPQCYDENAGHWHRAYQIRSEPPEHVNTFRRRNPSSFVKTGSMLPPKPCVLRAERSASLSVLRSRSLWMSRC